MVIVTTHYIEEARQSHTVVTFVNSFSYFVSVKVGFIFQFVKWLEVYLFCFISENIRCCVTFELAECVNSPLKQFDGFLVFVKNLKRNRLAICFFKKLNFTCGSKLSSFSNCSSSPLVCKGVQKATEKLNKNQLASSTKMNETMKTLIFVYFYSCQTL